jgi:hypothetical protein
MSKWGSVKIIGLREFRAGHQVRHHRTRRSPSAQYAKPRCRGWFDSFLKLGRVRGLHAMYDVALSVSAKVAVIVDFPDDILWVLLVQRGLWIDARMNENAVIIDVHQRQSLYPPQVLGGYDCYVGFLAFLLPVGGSASRHRAIG